jgi:hypothetical protein
MVRTVETLSGQTVNVMRGTVENLLTEACTVRLSRFSDSDEDWSGATFDVATSLAFTGWSEALATVDDLFARITAKHTSSIIPTLAYSDEPDGDVDVERWLAGDDECYLIQTAGAFTVPVVGTFVDLILDPFASCVVDADVVLRRGVYFAALAYMLERAGYRVKIRLMMPTTGEGKHWLVEADLKDFAQPLDLPRALYWLAHPAALRQHMISAYRGQREDAIYKWGGGFEWPVDAVVAPRITADTDLDSWLAGLLSKFNLVLEGA